MSSSVQNKKVKKHDLREMIANLREYEMTNNRYNDTREFKGKIINVQECCTFLQTHYSVCTSFKIYDNEEISLIIDMDEVDDEILNGSKFVEEFRKAFDVMCYNKTNRNKQKKPTDIQEEITKYNKRFWKRYGDVKSQYYRLHNYITPSIENQTVSHANMPDIQNQYFDHTYSQNRGVTNPNLYCPYSQSSPFIHQELTGPPYCWQSNGISYPYPPQQEYIHYYESPQTYYSQLSNQVEPSNSTLSYLQSYTSESDLT